MERWQLEMPRHCPSSISINIARRQLLQANFVDSIRTIARDAKIDTKQIQLEITETEVMTDVDYSIEVMNELRRAGFKIAIDDFGTGYSSLACLDRFPVDTLKIDRSIIADICTKDFSAKLVELVLKLAAETGITIVAEGIETKSQQDLLKSWGCDYGQGFVLSRPMVPESVSAFFRRNCELQPK